MSRIKNFFGYIKQAAQKLLFTPGTPLAPLHRNIPYINKDQAYVLSGESLESSWKNQTA